MKTPLFISNKFLQVKIIPILLFWHLSLFTSNMQVNAQSLVAGWDFQTTSNGGTSIAAAPNTPLFYSANFGSGSLYLNGSFGSSTWINASSGNQLNSFNGTAINAAPGFSTTTTSPASLALVNQTANNKSIVFAFNMSGKMNLNVSYASQRTSNGFTTQQWDYSTDAINWTSFQTVNSLLTTFSVINLNLIQALSNVSTAYLRVTFIGATAAAGNNRLDNIQLNASPILVGPFDLSIKNLHVDSAPSTCLGNNESIVFDICNQGTTPIDLSIYPVTVGIQVDGPNGKQTKTAVINNGLLSTFGNNSLTYTALSADLHRGGSYTINAGVSSNAPSNDSLTNDSISISVNNTKPNAIDKTICQDENFSYGEGLQISACGTPITDSFDISFTILGTCSDGNDNSSACLFASTILPIPQNVQTISGGTLSVTNLSGIALSYSNEIRFNVYKDVPSTPTLFLPGGVSSGATPGEGFTQFHYNAPVSVTSIQDLLANVNPGDILNMGYWESFDDVTSASDIALNSGGTSTATLRIYYTGSTVATQWYDSPSAGALIASQPIFNPLNYANSIVSNSNTPGDYLFFAACADQNTCRTPVTLHIRPQPIVNVLSNVSCNGTNTGSAEAIIEPIPNKLHIDIPFEHSFTVANAIFGPSISTQPVQGQLAQFAANDDGCNAYPAGFFAGKVAMIKRGDCNFELKAFHAQEAGATAVIIFNNISGPPILMGTLNLYTINIPIIMISLEDGNILQNYLQANMLVTGNTALYTYAWSNATTSALIDNVASGTYQVDVSDEIGCSASNQVNVIAKEIPSIQCASSLICPSANNGFAEAILNDFPYELYFTSPIVTQTNMAGAQFGPSVTTMLLQGDIKYVAEPSLGCNSFAPGEFAGKIALIDRGGCFFEQKVFNAQNAGAIGVIIANNVSDPIFTMGFVNQFVITIPSIMISQADGQSIKDALALNLTITCNTALPYAMLWSNGSTNINANGLIAGVQSVQVTDNVGCTATCFTEIIELTPPPSPTFEPITKSILCNDSIVLEITNADKCLSFNGINHWVETNVDLLNVDDGNFTIEAWIKTTGTDMGVVVSSDNDMDWELGERALYIGPSGQPIFVGYGNDYIVGNFAVNDNVWHHIAVTRDYTNGTAYIYVDGYNRTDLVNYHPNTTPNIGTFSIGRPNGTIAEAPNFFSGSIDEVRFWNTSRNYIEIRNTMYHEIETINDPNLVAYYRFNEGFGSLTKSEKNGYHASTMNQPSWMQSGAFNTNYLLQYTGGSSTSSSPFFTIASAGEFTPVVLTPFGCSYAGNPFTIDSTVTLQASGSTTFCENGSVILTANTNANSTRFASGVINFSSQYTLDAWGAVQLLGSPDIYPNYGDISAAWASASPDGQREFLELGFANPAPINYIDIYETFACGAIDTVYIKNPNTNTWQIVYTATASALAPIARILHIEFPTTNFDVSEIRIAINSPNVASWNEIDAAAIGLQPSYVWSNGSTNTRVEIDSAGTYSATLLFGNSCNKTSNSIQVTTENCDVMLDIKLFIQGYYNGAQTMREVLFNQGETVLPGITDSMEVCLHEEFFPYAQVACTPVLLRNDGNSHVTFNGVVPGNYYLQIKHRTAIETWSFAPVAVLANPTFYDFTNDAGKAYGYNQTQVDLGVFAFYSGDIIKDANEAIGLDDILQLELDNTNFEFGYKATDINGDGGVDLDDFPIVEININNFIYANYPTN